MYNLWVNLRKKNIKQKDFLGVYCECLLCGYSHGTSANCYSLNNTQLNKFRIGIIPLLIWLMKKCFQGKYYVNNKRTKMFFKNITRQYFFETYFKNWIIYFPYFLLSFSNLF